MSSASGDAVAQLLSRQVVQMSTCGHGRAFQEGRPKPDGPHGRRCRGQTGRVQ